ncbi:MAG: PD40 domain-containing protein [Phycisphaerales bacterium]|nr:MAG: PD40 domain-containing protein [Phycisphaerales bacterium]
MTAKRLGILLAPVIAAASVALVFSVHKTGAEVPQNPAAVSTPAKISPDYTAIVIPPNIAPLNFCIEQPGAAYFVAIRSSRPPDIEISSRTAAIEIPPRQWRRLLAANRGNPLHFDIHVKDNNGNWKRYPTITNTIARDDIDPYIAYRLMKPQYNFYRNLGVYQRNLESFEESLILHGRSFDNGCVNCHTFFKGNPEEMFLGVRSSAHGSGTLLVRDRKVSTIGTTFGHTSWHPTGRIAAFSKYDVRLFFHTARAEARDAIEYDSLLAYYLVDSQTVKTVPAIADKQRLETQPTWSPDGRYLYFPSAPMLWPEKQKFPPDRYNQVKYDLVRISYDVESDQWGPLETVLSADQTGLSILTPRISPDGRFLLFTMCEYGCFGLWQPTSDLYLMHLDSGKHDRLECNSPFAESWHAWSTNGRWIVFSSKRPTGVFTRLYFSYIDESGKAHKPFVLPQKNPRFYDSFVELYNVPEFITGPVRVSRRKLAGAVRTADRITLDAITKPSPKTQGPPPWQQR